MNTPVSEPRNARIPKADSRKQYNSAVCGQTITISYNGMSTQATVMDEVSDLCTGIPLRSDLLPSVVPILRLRKFGYDSVPIFVLCAPIDGYIPNDVGLY